MVQHVHSHLLIVGEHIQNVQMLGIPCFGAQQQRIIAHMANGETVSQTVRFFLKDIHANCICASLLHT